MSAIETTLPYPPLIRGKKFIALSDWDGTITTRDSNDYMTDNLGYGAEKRRQGNLDILSGKVEYKDAFKEMLQSVADNGHTIDECKEILRKNIVLDPGFLSFHAYCVAHDIPIIIVSSGMTPIIRAVLSNLLPEDAAATIPIISNEVEPLADGKWTIKYRHPTSPHGHDKSYSILPYTSLPEGERPTTFFFGDGVSDLSAARYADILFAKLKDNGESDLAEYCRKEDIPHRTFKNFEEVIDMIKPFVEGGEK